MLIVDMSGVSAIDPTANAAFAKVRTLAKRRGIELVWAGMNKSVRRRLGQWKILDGAKDFKTLDDAEKFVEDELLEHVHVLAQRWLFDAAARSIYNHTMLHDAITANTSVSDGLLGPSHLLQWAEKVVVSGNKFEDKLYRRHETGRPGSLKTETFRALQGRIPERIIEKAVRGMLPKNRMGRELFTQLKVYAGPEHPHAAQNPADVTAEVKERCYSSSMAK